MTTRIVKEASELGLRPGYFPPFLTLDGVALTRVLIDRSPDGEVHGVTYENPNVVLLVLND